jgi:hypothetical protein
LNDKKGSKNMEYMKVEKLERSRTTVYVGLSLVYLCDYEYEVEKIVKQFGKEKCVIERKGK